MADHSNILTNLWMGKRSAARELVDTTATATNGAVTKSAFYHTRSAVEGDRFTSKDDIRDFLKVARAMGALDEKTIALISNNDFLKAFGKTDRVVDVYVTDAGLVELAKLARPENKAKLEAAYAEAFKELEGVDAAWLTTTDATKRASMENTLQQASDPMARNNGQGADMENFWHFDTGLPGYTVWAAAAGFKELKNIQAMAAALNSEATPLERATAFAAADKQVGLDFSRALYAFSRLVGADNVMVQELAVKDSKGHNMVFMAEGAPTDPSTAINALMASVG